MVGAPIRRTLVIASGLLLATAVVSGCGDDAEVGSTAPPPDRGNALLEHEFFQHVSAGGNVSADAELRRAGTTDDPTMPTTDDHAVTQLLRMDGPPKDVAREYVPLLQERGWEEIRVRCTRGLHADSWNVFIEAATNEGYRIDAQLDLSGGSNTLVIASLRAHPTDDGAPTGAGPPEASCLDTEPGSEG